MGAQILPDLQLAALCRGFSLMLHAGISLADSAFLLTETESESQRILLQTLGKQLDQGSVLSQAMEQTGCFPHYITGMIRIGEQTGHLEQALTSLADFFEERQRITRQLCSAVAYPSLILMLILGVIGVLLIQVLPVFDQVYASLGSRLTGIAGGLLAAGRWLQKLLPVLLILLIAAAIAAAVFSLCPSLREKVTTSLRRRFGDRGVSRRYNNARFARAAAMGLASGLTLEDTLALARQLLSDSPCAASRCQICADHLAEGDSLAEAMSQAGLLSPHHSRLLTVGLRGGNADQVMAKIADDLEEEAALSLERSISRIEPAMVLTASLLVGGILLTVMLPLMNILSTLG